MIKVASEYSIVRGNTASELVKNVGAAIRDGFEPQGGVSVFEGTDTYVFMQAVTRYVVVRSVEEYDQLMNDIDAASTSRAAGDR